MKPWMGLNLQTLPMKLSLAYTMQKLLQRLRKKKILLLQLKFDFHVNIFCFQCMKNEGKYII